MTEASMGFQRTEKPVSSSCHPPAGSVWTTGSAAATLNIASFCTLLLIGWLDYITGYELGFFIFYFIPVSISAWFVSRSSGLFMACASAATWYLSDSLTRHPYSNAYLIYWEMWMRLVSFITTAATVAKIRSAVNQEKTLKAKLSLAEQEIEELKGRLREQCAVNPEAEEDMR